MDKNQETLKLLSALSSGVSTEELAALSRAQNYDVSYLVLETENSQKDIISVSRLNCF